MYFILRLLTNNFLATQQILKYYLLIAENTMTELKKYYVYINLDMQKRSFNTMELDTFLM